jgi:hypothetical protein
MGRRRRKIHSFRCCFRRELKRVLDSQKSETSADDVYVPNLWYYDLLSFIADSEIPRRGKSNIDNTDEISTHKCSNILTAYFIKKITRFADTLLHFIMYEPSTI